MHTSTIQFNLILLIFQNLQQYGGLFKNRPGRPTSDYLRKIVNRITMIGAMGLAVLAIIPSIVSAVLEYTLPLGGTSVIIAVGVIVKLLNKIEAMMQMRHYKGFLNK